MLVSLDKNKIYTHAHNFPVKFCHTVNANWLRKVYNAGLGVNTTKPSGFTTTVC